MTRWDETQSAEGVFRSIVAGGLPLFLSMIAASVGSAIVVAILGDYDTAALAAFNLTGSVYTPASVALSGCLRAAVPFIAPYRENPRVAVPIIRDSYWFGVVIGTMGAFPVTLVPLVGSLFGASPEILNELGSLPLLMALNLLVITVGGARTSVLIAYGKNRQVLWVAVTSTASAMLLTPLLVSGAGFLPGLGISGAGVALVVSSTASAVQANIHLRNVPVLSGASLWPGRPRPHKIKELARVGVPSSATLLVKAFALGLASLGVARIGASAGAVHAVLSSINGFLMVASLATAQAAVPILARAAAAGDLALCRRIARTSLLVGVSVAGAGACVLLAAKPWIIGVFTPDPAVRGEVGSLLGLMILSALPEGAKAASGRSLLALKEARVSLVNFAVGYSLLALSIFPVRDHFGLAGIWWSIAAVNVYLAIKQTIDFRRTSRVKIQAPA